MPFVIEGSMLTSHSLGFRSFVAQLALLWTLIAPGLTATAEDIPNIDLSARCGESVVVDVHAPNSYAGLPIILVVHGGGWMSGSKEDLRPFARNLAGAGFVTVNIEYPRKLRSTLPELIERQLQSIRCVRSWVGGYLATSMALDNRRIGIIGQSAGGHLAVVSAQRDGPSRYQAYVGLSGVYQLPKFYPRSFPEDSATAAINPIQLLDRATGSGFLIHGSADEILPTRDVREFFVAMKSRGHPIRFAVTGGGHNLASSDYFNWSTSFFKQIFAGNPQRPGPVATPTGVPTVVPTSSATKPPTPTATPFPTVTPGGVNRPPETPVQPANTWKCDVGIENGALWMRTKFAGVDQFAWRIGAGGSMAELVDSANNNTSLLAPTFAGEVTDRAIQWTIWNASLSLGPDTEDTLNVTQAGTAYNKLTPTMGIHFEKSGRSCRASVLSHPRDQWTLRQTAHFKGSFPSMTTYELTGGILTIRREVLVESIARDGIPVSATDLYFEAWSPFSGREFDTLALNFDAHGDPGWHYRHTYNIPPYPKFPFSATSGFAVVYDSNRVKAGPVIGLAFGKSPSTPGKLRMLNMMDFDRGIAVLPSLKMARVPTGSLITQELKMYMTRGISTGLTAQLTSVADSVQPAMVYEPNEALGAELEEIRRVLRTVSTLPGFRTEWLGQVPRD